MALLVVWGSILGTSDLNQNKVCVISTPQALKGHCSHVSAVAISSGRQPKIISASWDFSIRVWDMLRGDHLLTYTGHSCRIYAVGVSVSNLVVSGGSHDGIHVWNLLTGARLWVLHGHEGSVQSLSVCDSCTVPLTHCLRTLNCSTCHSSVPPVAVSGGEDGRVVLWNLCSGETVRSLEHNPDTHGHIWAVVSVTISKGSDTFIVSGSSCGTIIMWDAASGKRLYTLEGHFGPISGLCISERRGAACATESTLYMSLYRDRHPVRSTNSESIGFQNLQRRLVSSSADWTVRVWDLDKGELLRVLQGGHSGGVECIALLGGYVDSNARMHTPYMCKWENNRLSRHPIIVSGGRDATVRVWDMETGSLYRTLEDVSPVCCVAVSGSGCRPVIATGGTDSAALQMWDLDRIICDINWERRKSMAIFVHSLRVVMNTEGIQNLKCGSSPDRVVSPPISFIKVMYVDDLCSHIASFL
eukprot:CAMPEP_0185028138 /NCGR_PEP_ID=MMETSP1103-20130426/13700_1 /TAXON_ID=36769 /ORGANISM="Paraphysomonas bandaiensis, Strain Caron Lab Isolate" /LENGTH=471 /DNA_ID=CAMNT_0027562447 /DNA_START=210 /DNA_END=1625 /DNA_ORIENTATION=-